MADGTQLPQGKLTWGSREPHPLDRSKKAVKKRLRRRRKAGR